MPRIVHFEISADDPERAKQFYEEAFGWKMQKWEGGNEDYWMIETGPKDEPGINGGLFRRNPRQANWVDTIDVKDIDLAIEAIKSAGGKAVKEKMEIPGVGWMTYCEDTEGNAFGIMQSTGDGMM